MINKGKLIITVALLCSLNSIFAANYFVSPEGQATNSGTIDSPFDFATAIEKLNSMDTHSPMTINVRGGRYYFSESFLLGEQVQGTVDNPVIIKAYNGEEVIFDGGRTIKSKGFSHVKNNKERAKLSAKAADEIYVKTIKDKELIKKFSGKIEQLLSIDGGIFLPSCFPNEGYAEFNLKQSVQEVSLPAVIGYKSGIRAGIGDFREPGKEEGWRGSLEEPRGAQVGFASQTDAMAGTWQQWADEVKRNNKRNQLNGFVAAHWLLSRMPIFDVNAEEETVHLAEAMNYGWGCIPDKIFKVFGLLCELDQPGEWHFDVSTNRLYIYPLQAVSENTHIGLPYSTGFMTLEGTSYVHIEGLKVVNVGEGTIFDIKSGEHNLIAGCTMNNSTAKGACLNGKYNGVKSCDFIDLNAHVTIDGGVRAPHEISSGYNYVENCHFYQKYFKHEKVNISMGGVGNIFRNNLIHNSIGQAMIVYGNDQLVELNEFFNVGYEEGDGGAVYSGADLAGYGNVYRHNFFHHLMNVPGKTDRAGIHLDDLQAGATCDGNIFYKSAAKGIFMNAGCGHTLINNVNLEGRVGIYNVGVGAKIFYDLQEAILKDPNHSHVNTKENYIGNAEKTIGKEGWNNQVWKTKYPRFHMVMNDTGEFGRMSPIACVVKHNYGYGHTFSDTTVWSRFTPEARAKSIIEDDVIVSPSDFVNYDEMDFTFKSSRLEYPRIPFTTIGLYTDGYRETVPNKKEYRMAIKSFFDGITTSPGTTKTINTAELIESVSQSK